MARKLTKKINKEFIDPKRLVSTGCTTFNCACSNDHRGGLQLGKVTNLIGNSASGKTMVAFSIAAEMINDPKFEHYRVIYDDVEAALEFNTEYLFGKKLSDKIESPDKNKNGEPICSETTFHFHNNILNALEKEEPFIYILDSLDALDDLADQKKLKEQRKDFQKGNKITGSMGMAKAKGMSGLLRSICRDLNKSQSILLIISQVRDNVDVMSFKTEDRAGGRALKFYCTIEVWIKNAGSIKSKGLIIGKKVKGRITKSKITGNDREFNLRIYNDYGIDDLRSCIDFLIDSDYWKKKKNTIIAEDFNLECSMNKLIEEIEEQNLERKLKRIVGAVWKLREDSVKMDRKRKY
jgi:RecA/RadA recombinase